MVDQLEEWEVDIMVDQWEELELDQLEEREVDIMVDQWEEWVVDITVDHLEEWGVALITSQVELAAVWVVLITLGHHQFIKLEQLRTFEWK